MSTTGKANAKLLLIDDDIELCELLVEYLATEGFNVFAVHDGEAGVDEALSGVYDLVLLDVTLPRPVSYTHLTLPTTKCV